MDKIRQRIQESIDIKTKVLGDPAIAAGIDKAAGIIVDCYKKNNGTVFFAGNGGSASDSQHLACELESRFYMDRPALSSEALNTNTSVITAIGNDYSFDRIFARQLEANGRRGDVFVGLSTSGNSKNIVEAIKVCRQKGISIIGFTGDGGGTMKDLCDVLIAVPAKDTPRVQECHILLGHILCEIVESAMFSR